MLLAHKIELRPTTEQVEYLDRACGSRRHCYNQLLEYFSQEGVKWSKKAGNELYKALRAKYEWYSEVSQRVTRSAVEDLENAFRHFFRRCKAGVKVGFPRFKRRGVKDSFALREAEKFTVDGRLLRLEKLKTKIKMVQKLRFSGVNKQVTISKRAGKYFASILVETDDYDTKDHQKSKIVGVDLGIKSLAVLSDGDTIPANQKLKRSLNKLAKLQRALARKQKGSNHRARAKLRVAKLHLRVANQRSAVLHELTNHLTASYENIVIEDLDVKGMVKNHCLARAISDAGFGMFRQQLEYKAKLRGCEIIIASRWFASTKLCSECGAKKPMPLSQRLYICPCGNTMDRDLNAAINLKNYGEDTFKPTTKRTEESRKSIEVDGGDVDDVNEISFCPLGQSGTL